MSILTTLPRASSKLDNRESYGFFLAFDASKLLANLAKKHPGQQKVE
jgi:hypothetical protein